jgi:threonine synthase
MAVTRNVFLTLLLVAVVAAGAFGVAFLASGDRALRLAARQGDALEWLRVEFALDAERFAAVRRLHEEFSIECSAHCAAIVAARERAAPAAEIAALEEHCVVAMTAHFRQVAARMEPAQGERYLALVLPRIRGHSHQGAPSVRLAP